MDGVLLGKADGEGAFERIQICKNNGRQGGSGGTFEEQGGLWVLDGERGTLSNNTSNTSGFGLAGYILVTLSAIGRC